MNSETPVPASTLDARKLSFGRFELDLGRGSLLRDGIEVALRPKTFALLKHLLAHRGRLLTKDELLHDLWPGVVVTEDSLVQCVGELRVALEDRSQRLIRTVPRRGYRFDGQVDPSTPGIAEQTAESVNPGVVASSRALPPVVPALAGITRPVVIGCMVALVVGALALWVGSRPGRVFVDQAIASERAIAILPFVDLNDRATPAFAEALAEDLAISIARLNDTVVFSPASTTRLGAKADVQEVGRVLKATHVLGGSVEHSADGLMVRAQLANATTGAVLWSDRFQYSASDRWSLQQDLSQRVANALDTRMHDDHSPFPGPRTKADDAEATLQAMYLIRRIRSRDEVLQARALLDRALESDPDSVAALTYWGFSHALEVTRRWSTDRPGQIAKASGAFEKALRLRPDYAQAHFGRSLIAAAEGRLDDAIRACQEALRYWPNEPRCLQRIGLTNLMQGKPEGVAAPVELSLRLNPLESNQVAWGHIFLGMAKFHMHQDDAAYTELQTAAAADPNNAFARQWMAAIDALHGRSAASATHLAAYLKVLPGHTIKSLKATETSTSPEFWKERERFYVGLRMAGLPD